MVLFRLGQKRNFPTAATPFAVPLAVTAPALPEALPATLTLWATTSRANDGAARQPVRTTRANSFLIFPPFLLLSGVLRSIAKGSKAKIPPPARFFFTFGE